MSSERARSGDATTASVRTSEALALAARSGEREAFDALVVRFEGPLVRFLAVRAGGVADAEELAQETFLRAWEARARFDARWRYSTWLYAIASRLATSHARRRRPELGDAGDSLVARGGDPLELAGEREERHGLWALAARVLSADQRAALWLRYGEDQSPEEIARILGRRVVTVRVILFRARERLASHLEAVSQDARMETRKSRAAARSHRPPTTSGVSG